MGARWIAALLLAPCAYAQTKNYANPTYQLTGGDYKQESPAINQMLRNDFIEAQYLQKQINAVPTASASGATVTVNAPLSGTGASSNPVALTGAIAQVNVNLSTVPATGSCTLPNVVTALNAGAAPTCTQPSNVTGNAATVTTNANLSGDVTSVGNVTTAAATQPNIVTLSSPSGLTVTYGITGGSLTVKNASTVVGTETVKGNAFSVGGSSFTVGGGSSALAYQFAPGSINLTGPNGNYTSQSSVTASAFFGDASHLTGITEGQVTNLTTDLAAKVAKAGDTMTGQLTNTSTDTVLGADVNGMSARFRYGVSVGSITASSATFTATGNSQYSVALSSSLTFTQNTTAIGIKWADGTVSTTASSGAGGGGAQGPAGPASTQTITWQIDNFLGQVTGSKTSFNLSGIPSSTQSIIVVLDGLLQSGTSDYTYNGASIVMTTAPAANSNSFFAQYTINTSTLAAAMLVNSTDTVSGAKTFLSTITINGSANFWVPASTYTVNSDSVFASTFSLIATTAAYHINFDYTNSATVVSPGFRLGGDAGANYSNTCLIDVVGAGWVAPATTGTGKTSLAITDSNGVTASTYFWGEIWFQPMANTASLEKWRYRLDSHDNRGANGNDEHMVCTGIYTGSAAPAVAAITLLGSGNFSGTAWMDIHR